MGRIDATATAKNVTGLSPDIMMPMSSFCRRLLMDCPAFLPRDLPPFLVVGAGERDRVAEEELFEVAADAMMVCFR